MKLKLELDKFDKGHVEKAVKSQLSQFTKQLEQRLMSQEKLNRSDIKKSLNREINRNANIHLQSTSPSA